MRSSLTNTLLALVILALFADIVLRVQPVHAQNGSTAYLDQVPYNPGKLSQQVHIQGTTVLAMSCADNYCNVLTQ